MIGWATDHIPLPGGVARQLAQMIRDNAIGHVGLLVGRTAAKTTIPAIIDFLLRRSEAPAWAGIPADPAPYDTKGEA